MRYVNNWITQLAADFAPDSVELPLAGSAQSRLGNGEYLLTLVDSINPVEQTLWEVVKVVVASGQMTITRGQEETIAQYWPAGSVIYCGVTAGGMNQLLAQGSSLAARVAALEGGGWLNEIYAELDGLAARLTNLEGGGVEDGSLVDAAGNFLTDPQGNNLI